MSTAPHDDVRGRWLFWAWEIQRNAVIAALEQQLGIELTVLS